MASAFSSSSSSSSTHQQTTTNILNYELVGEKLPLLLVDGGGGQRRRRRRYNGIVSATNGKLYAIPHNVSSTTNSSSTTRKVLCFDPTLNSQFEIGNDLRISSRGVVHHEEQGDGDSGYMCSNSSSTTTTEEEESEWWGGYMCQSNHKIYCPPFNSNKILVIDTNTNTTELIPTGLLHSNRNGKYYKTVAQGKGKGKEKGEDTDKLYFFPYYADKIMTLDINTHEVSFVEEYNREEKEHWQDAICTQKDGLIYVLPETTDDTGYLMVFDPNHNNNNNSNNNSNSSNGQEEEGGGRIHKIEHEMFQIPLQKLIEHHNDTNDDEDYLYVIPTNHHNHNNNNHQILKFHIATKTIFIVEGSNNSSTTTSSTTNDTQWIGDVVWSTNDECIYKIPQNTSQKVWKYNPVDDSTTTISLIGESSSLLSSSNSNNNDQSSSSLIQWKASCCCGIDGNIYCAPFDSDQIVKFSIPITTTTTQKSNEQQSPPPSSLLLPPIIAVRKKGPVVSGHQRSCCIFLNWDDCQRFINNSSDDDNDGNNNSGNSSYEIERFHTMEEAVAYITTHITSTQGANRSGGGGTADNNNNDHGDDDDDDDDDSNPFPTQQIKRRKITSSSSSSSSRSNPSGYKAMSNPNRRPTKHWDKMFQYAKTYKETHDTFEIITSLDDDHDHDHDHEKQKSNQEEDTITTTNNASSLKKWMTQQQREYQKFKEGQSSSMFEQKIEKLKKIGFQFDYISIDERIQALLKFKQKYGHYKVPINDNERSLGWWVHKKQKKIASKFVNGNPTPYFDFLLKDLLQIEQTSSSSSSSDTKKHNKTTTKKLLEDDGSKKEEKWNEFFEKLKAYKALHNTCKVPPSHQTPLSNWVLKQHQEYQKLQDNEGRRREEGVASSSSSSNNSELTAEHIQRLNDLGFVFRQINKKYTWEERMEQLRKYKEEHGNTRVPKSNKLLGSFVNRQRLEYSRWIKGETKTSMNEHRVRDLNSLNFIFEAGKKMPTHAAGVVKKTWDERYQELLEYRTLYGHVLVPQTYAGLGEWVHTQRGYYRRLKKGESSPLTAERVLMLADIGFIFDASKKRGNRL